MRDCILDSRTDLTEDLFNSMVSEHQSKGYVLELTWRENPSARRLHLSTEFMWVADFSSIRPAFETANTLSDQRSRANLKKIYDFSRGYDQQYPQDPAIACEMRACNALLTDKLDTSIIISALRTMIPAH